MKAKILLTALLTFLLVYGKASQFNSTLIIDLAEHPKKTYLVELGNGDVYESDGDFKINNVRFGVQDIKIFEKRISRRGARGQQTSTERLMYVGVVKIPRNSTVFSRLVNRRLNIHRVIKKKAPRAIAAAGMSPEHFKRLRRSVVQESFDKNKLEVLRFATRHNSLNSRQVAKLMDLLTFDKYKLEFAKFAYRCTLDKQNYLIVRDKLTFLSNRKKLMRFIESQPIQQRRNGRKGGRR